MEPVQFKGQTHVLGAPANWNGERDGECFGLPVLVASGGFTSVWKPTSDDIIAMSQGESIVLFVHGKVHPVVSMSVQKVEHAD
jgi:hypothetical protein